MRTAKIQKRLIKRTVIDQPESEEIIKNIFEILGDLKQNEINSEIIGKILYETTMLANVCNIDPEQALYDFNEKIIKIL